MYIAILLLAFVVETAWYAWSRVRCFVMLQYLRSPKVRRACMHAHKPLIFVVLLYAAVGAWRAWAQYATGASVDSVFLSGGVGGKGTAADVKANIWTWRCNTPPSAAKAAGGGGGVRNKVIILFPGAGFGAVPYARFARAVSTYAQATVMALEDPREFCGHHLYLPSSDPCLTPRQWQLLYMHACLQSGAAAGASEDIYVFAHSNGSFRAAFVCREALTPPAHALFYEPTALRADWLQDRVSTPVDASWLNRTICWLVNKDEVLIKTVISAQSAAPYNGAHYADPRLLLVSRLRAGVDYAVDTADDDYIMSASEVYARLDAHMASHPDDGQARIRRFRHAGYHGQFSEASEYPDSALDVIFQGWGAEAKLKAS